MAISFTSNNSSSFKNVPTNALFEYNSITYRKTDDKGEIHDQHGKSVLINIPMDAVVKLVESLDPYKLTYVLS